MEKTMRIKTCLLVAVFAMVSICDVCAADYYVDAEYGNDANSGLEPGEGNAKQSFAALFAAYPSMASGSTVHAAPGVYSNGVMTATTGYTGGYRVIVPAGVTIVADKGPEKTIIKGAPADGVSLNESPYGCGQGAIRCVQLSGVDATVKDFTLTDGHSTAFDGDSRVGAVDGSVGGSAMVRKTYVVGCIITNNVAGRAAGVQSSTAIQCFFDDNRTINTGCDVMVGSAFNCIFGNLLNNDAYNVYQGGPYVNNLFFGSGKCAHDIALYNSVVLKNAVDNRTCFTNCIGTATVGTYGGGSKKFSSESYVKLDSNWRPGRDSPCIDAGESSYYTDNIPVALGDDRYRDYQGNQRIVGASIDIGACEGRFAKTGPANFYVNVKTGSDSNDGATPDKAYKTLKAALSDAEIASNDVVNVAAGVYSEGTKTADSREYRAVIPSGVTLLGAGADVTTIEGAEDKVNGTAETYWCGADAIGCVRLNAGSTVRGFTLTKGHAHWTKVSSDAEIWGGAVNASGVGDAAYIVDCVVTNNFAVRGAGLHGGTAIRCRFNDNGVSLTGTDMINGVAWNCLFGNVINTAAYNVYNGGPYINCTFYGSGKACYDPNASNTRIIRNSVILKGRGNNVVYENCAVINTTALTDSDTDSFSLSEAEMKLDERYAPQPGSPLVDRGNGGYYDAFPAAVADAYSKADLSGGQRIYNGAVDIGALEYDWRGDFASRISKRNLTVVEANPGVVTNGTAAISIPSECSVTIDWDLLESGSYSFRVAATGAGVTVLRDGVAMSGDADGIYRFGHEGERATTQIVISCDNSSSAVIDSFRTNRGFILSFR